MTLTRNLYLKKERKQKRKTSNDPRTIQVTKHLQQIRITKHKATKSASTWQNQCYAMQEDMKEELATKIATKINLQKLFFF